MLGKPVMSLDPGSGQLDKLDIFVALITGDLSVGNLTANASKIPFTSFLYISPGSGFLPLNTKGSPWYTFSSITWLISELTYSLKCVYIMYKLTGT